MIVPRPVLEPALRRRLVLAGALAVLALGLPWTTASYVPGYYTPGFCTTTYDANGYGSVDCGPGFIGAGYSNPASPGFAIDVRVYAALLLVTAVWGLGRRSAALLTIALTFGLAALIRNPGSQAGQLVWVAALLLGGHALADAGLLGPTAGRWLSRRRRQLRRLRGSHPGGQRPPAAPGAAHR